MEGGKTGLAQHLSTLKESSRVLFVTKSSSSLNQAVKALASNQRLAIVSPFVKNEFSPEEQIKALVAKRQHLLRDAVAVLAESLDYKVFQEYTCERAAIFFTNAVKPLWDSYAVDRVGQFPFSGFFLKYL